MWRACGGNGRSQYFGFVLIACVLAGPLVTFQDVQAAPSEERQAKCKAAMNARIQVCTDDCTARALAAASHYVDKNNNVKFGCLKGCALGQILQMRACVNGQDPNVMDPTETNR